MLAKRAINLGSNLNIRNHKIFFSFVLNLSNKSIDNSTLLFLIKIKFSGIVLYSLPKKIHYYPQEKFYLLDKIYVYY